MDRVFLIPAHAVSSLMKLAWNAPFAGMTKRGAYRLRSDGYVNREERSDVAIRGSQGALTFPWIASLRSQ